MENTNQNFALDTNADFMLNAFMHAVNQHIDKRIEARLKTINEAAITDYVQQAITARLSDTATNMQVMATLDTQLEAKIKQMIDAAIYDHKDAEEHNTRDDIRNTVEDMDLTDNLTAKVEEIVGDVDLSSNLESAIEAYLTDNHYASVDYVDEKMDNLEDAAGFKSAVKDVVKDMTFEINVRSY